MYCEYYVTQANCKSATPSINDAVLSDVILGSGLRSVIASNSLINFTLALVKSVGLDHDYESSEYNLVSMIIWTLIMGTKFDYKEHS